MKNYHTNKRKLYNELEKNEREIENIEKLEKNKYKQTIKNKRQKL